MQYRMSLLLVGLLSPIVSVASPVEFEVSSHSLPHKRWNKQNTFGGNWVALGDSFSAGPLSGNSINDVCLRFDKSYPQLLQDEYWPTRAGDSAHTLNFQSCAGASVDDVITKQLPHMNDASSSIKFVTLMVGASDVAFSKVLLSCVGGVPSSGNCDDGLAEARTVLYSSAFWKKYQLLINGIIDKSTYASQSSKRPVIYQNSYPALFDSFTTQCNDAVFSPLSGTTGPKMTTAVRRKVNSLTAELNIMLSYFIAHVNYRRQQENASPILFIDNDEEYKNHRFCREGIVEPKLGDLATWFFHPKSGVYGATAADFSGVDTSTCQNTDKLDSLYKCFIAKELAGNPGLDMASLVVPSSVNKFFRPKIDAHAAVASSLRRTMEFEPETPDFGYPLRILAAGDSITVGSGSFDTGGYRGYLNTLLKRRNASGGIKWIGSKRNGQPADGLSHEGQSGIRAHELERMLDRIGSLEEKPNIVTLMIGTNNIQLNQDVTSSIVDLEKLLATIWRKAGDSTLVLLSAIIPNGGNGEEALPISDTQKRVHDYNARAKNVVNELRTKGANIAFVHTSLVQQDRYDQLHPNPGGYEKIAHDFFEAIEKAHDKSMIRKTDTLGPIPKPPRPASCPVNPSWTLQGEIANGFGLGADGESPINCVSKSSGGCTCSGPPQNPAYDIGLYGPNCPTMSYGNTHSVHFADLDGDGKAEYLHVGADGTVQVYHNQWNNNIPGWQFVYSFGGTRGAKRRSVQFADINGDGRADSLFVHTDGSVSGWRNSASYGVNPTEIFWFEEGEIAPATEMPGSRVLFADMDGDGRADMITISNAGALTVFYNAGPLPDTNPRGLKVKWERRKVTTAGVGGTHLQTRLADINGDGRADYMFVRDNSVVDAWLNGPPASGDVAGEPTWISKGVSAPRTDTGPEKIMFADIDGNGKEDYISVNPVDSSVRVWLNYCIQ